MNKNRGGLLFNETEVNLDGLPILIVACLLMTSGDKGVSLLISKTPRSCLAR